MKCFLVKNNYSLRSDSEFQRVLRLYYRLAAAFVKIWGIAAAKCQKTVCLLDLTPEAVRGYSEDVKDKAQGALPESSAPYFSYQVCKSTEFLNNCAAKRLFYDTLRNLCEFCEVLDCSYHLACVAVFVVIPSNNLNLIEVISDLSNHCLSCIEE